MDARNQPRNIRNVLRSWNRSLYPIWKRLFDILFSVVVLILVAPLFLLLALWIRRDSPGPVFFVQQRIGLRGRPFPIIKFRTMTVDTAKYGVKPEDDDSDARVTRVGRLLRRSGLDELPQFVNVLAGQMSVVGPRPEMPFLVERYDARQLRRLEVKPGITGPWQISPARQFPIHEHLEYDEDYMARQFLLLDLSLVLQTVVFACRKFAQCVRNRCRNTTTTCRNGKAS